MIDALQGQRGAPPQDPQGALRGDELAGLRQGTPAARQPDGVGDAGGPGRLAPARGGASGPVAPLRGPRDRDRAPAAPGLRPPVAADRGPAASARRPARRGRRRARPQLAGLSGRIEDFCRRVQQGLVQATFEQRRALVELLIDRVIVTDGEVEIRYVMPTDHASEQVRFCHLRLDYRAGPPGRERAHTMYARLQELRLSRAVLSKLRRTPQLPPLQ